MTNEETVARLKGLLLGTSCSGMENIGNYLQLLFARRRLIIESAWRLKSGKEIMLGSESSDELIAKLPEMLVGAAVISITILNDLHDLQIEFSNGKVLETFADSEEYEHWKLFGGPDEMIIAGPGTLWSNF